MDKENDNLYVMQLDYDIYGNWRDLLCFANINNEKRYLESYELRRCTLPLELKMLDIIGVDII